MENGATRPTITAVTMLYDIGRKRIHAGRTITKYIEWLNATLLVPLPFVVFLGPDIDASRIKLKPVDRIVVVDPEQLEMFKRRAQVDKIVRRRRRAERTYEITFLLTAYSMLVMSKLEFLARAARLTDTDGLLWLDAGLSRFFFEEDLPSARINDSYLQRIGDATFAATITETLAADLEAGHPSRDYAGSAIRLVTAGDMYVRRDKAQELADRLLRYADGWLARGVWDNEQVALGSMWLEGIEGAKAMEVSGEYALVLGGLLDGPEFRPRETRPKNWVPRALRETWPLKIWSDRIIERHRVAVLKAAGRL